MGMPEAFDIPRGSANFEGMDGTRDLFISHVNEEGTEAAAATAVVMGLRSAPAPQPVFRADHPFVFMIRDLKTSSILFIGRVTDPRPSDES